MNIINKVVCFLTGHIEIRMSVRTRPEGGGRYYVTTSFLYCPRCKRTRHDSRTK